MNYMILKYVCCCIIHECTENSTLLCTICSKKSLSTTQVTVQWHPQCLQRSSRLSLQGKSLILIHGHEHFVHKYIPKHWRIILNAALVKKKNSMDTLSNTWTTAKSWRHTYIVGAICSLVFFCNGLFILLEAVLLSGWRLTYLNCSNLFRFRHLSKNKYTLTSQVGSRILHFFVKTSLKNSLFALDITTLRFCGRKCS